MMMRMWPIIVAVVMLGATSVFVETVSHGEEQVANRPFSQFPLALSNRWEGRELGLEDKVLEILKLSDFMMRVYKPVFGSGDEQGQENPPGQALRVWLYVGFYQSQRTGVTYHSPKNCLPGAGWQFVKSEFVTLPMPDGEVITINQVLIQKGLDKQVILYWYHDRGRVIASEYWAKGYLLWDAMTKRRSDGSLVRISVPVQGGTVDAAFEQGVRFLHDLWPVLLEFMPDHAIL